MLRKDVDVKWIQEARNSFEKIKQALTEAPSLISPNYSKEFLAFSFASKDTVVAMLLQRNKDGYEHHIAFFNKALRYAKLNYDVLEKQAYTLVKALKSFNLYILQSKIIA